MNTRLSFFMNFQIIIYLNRGPGKVNIVSIKGMWFRVFLEMFSLLFAKILSPKEGRLYNFLLYC